MENENNAHRIFPRVLVVDDDPFYQSLMFSVLKRWNICPDISPDGRIAIQHLRKNDYDIILMDIDMPVMDGYETTRYIRKKMKIQTPIIAVSGNCKEGNKSRALEYGMNAYMMKPVEPDTLMSEMNRQLTGNKNFQSLNQQPCL